MHIFYTPEINTKLYTLSQDESKHCVKVLRLKSGDIIELIDGKGSKYTAQITDDNPKKCVVHIVESFKKENRKEIEFVIAVAPTKNISRYEFFLEKATEIGIDKIFPIITRFSERKSIKKERLEKILISATKQSKSFFKPDLNDQINFEDLIKKEFIGDKFIAHCYESKNKKHLKDVYKKGNNVMILIGPEGDFSEEEVNLSKKHGFIEISLSESRLRTETAGIVACQMIDFINS